MGKGGAAPHLFPYSSRAQRSTRPELGRRYLELLTENLGQPGFREIVVTAHDLDVKRDLVFALLGAKHRARFFTRPAPSDGGVRQIEAFDLTGAARDHVFDALSGALALPMACEPHLISFAPEGPWRGETHRLCDRPAALARLLEETAAAGAEQIIIVTAAPTEVPPALVEQLKPGGRLVIPVGATSEVQELRLIEKEADGRVRDRSVAPVRFVPLVKPS